MVDDKILLFSSIKASLKLMTKIKVESACILMILIKETYLDN